MAVLRRLGPGLTLALLAACGSSAAAVQWTPPASLPPGQSFTFAVPTISWYALALSLQKFNGPKVPECSSPAAHGASSCWSDTYYLAGQLCEVNPSPSNDKNFHAVEPKENASSPASVTLSVNLTGKQVAEAENGLSKNGCGETIQQDYEKTASVSSIQTWISDLEPTTTTAASTTTTTSTTRTRTTTTTIPTTTLPPTGVGATMHIVDESGNSFSVTLSHFDDPATTASSSVPPRPGDVFVGVGYRVVDTGNAPIIEEPIATTTVVDNSGATYRATGATLQNCPDSGQGFSQLLPGNSTTVCVVFEVPTQAHIAKVIWTELAAGAGNALYTWNVN